MPSLPFVDSIFSALDDMLISDFEEAACECKPFQFIECMEATVNCESACSALDFGAGTGAGTGSRENQKLISSTSAFETSNLYEDVQPITTGEVQSTAVPSLYEASSISSERKMLELPNLKGRPVGVTGYRFVHLHTFQTRVGRIYRGYSLRFPRIFGKIKSLKSKDMAKLVRMRNNMLEAWAIESSKAMAHDIAKWIADLDRV